MPRYCIHFIGYKLKTSAMVIDAFNKYVASMSKLSGLLAINFVGVEKGNLLHNVSFSGLNYNNTAKFEAEIVRNALQVAEYMPSLDRNLKQVIVSNNEQTHVIYVSKKMNYLIHLVGEAKINLALLSVVHKESYELLTTEISDEMLRQMLHEPEALKKVSNFKSMFFS